VVNQNGGSTLQAAYNSGNSIAVNPGVPVTLTGTGIIMDIGADLNVTGLIL